MESWTDIQPNKANLRFAFIREENLTGTLIRFLLQLHHRHPEISLFRSPVSE